MAENYRNPLSLLISMYRRAFTLIELLIVIAVIAIISIIVVLVLNPAEILRKSKDANRLSDLPTLMTALSTYAEDVGGSMGSSSVTYVSVPDPTATTTAGTDCTGIGFPFTGGGSFHCASPSTFRMVDGTGWIPINFRKASFGSSLGSLPIDPINTTSSNEYYSYQTDGTTYKLTGLPESQAFTAKTGSSPVLFMVGTNLAYDGGAWSLVPGNSTFGTNNFYVMKYDAACTQNGIALTTPIFNNGYWDNNSGASNCNPSNGLAPAALPNAIPIVEVSQTSAASYCANIGAHLITNNEWQTIAWNAEGVASNWSGGVVASGSLYAGHNDNSPGQISVASANDSEGYSGTDGPTSGGGTGAGGAGAQNQLRTLTLSNGSVIWDIAGNLFDWTNDAVTGTNEPNAGAGVFSWHEFTALATYGTMSQQTVGPANSAWNSTQGIGQIYSEGATDGTTYGFIRGGDWSHGSSVGLEALFLGNRPSDSGSSIGIRCAR